MGTCDTAISYFTLVIVLRQRVIIYPPYLNSKKTVAEGRRIPLDKGATMLDQLT